MKKILFFAICISIVQISFGQQKNAEKPIERDTAIRTGVLENGMTYYVRHNNKPANMADFYILHDVGAAQEEDNQNGLAHFLEHMAFNGTKNYPNKNLIEYLESIGVQFGANLNAGTGQQSTVYMMKDVPLKRGAIIDSALLILNDWSHYISLLPEEIESERGVILEEMRTGTNASRRMFDKQAPLIFNNTILSKRLVIGTEEILKNFTPQDIRDFYNSWYRTDMQAVVVVGDFDADKMEQQVKELFSKIPAVKDAKPKQDIVIPPYEEDKVLVLSDPEWPISLVSIYYPLENYAPKQLNNSYGAIERNLKQALFEEIGRAHV